MAIERVFLGWDEPLLPRVADWIAAQSPSGDFADWVVVLSGRRAGRRLLEILLEHDRLPRDCLVPPRIATASTLVDFLHRPAGTAASSLVRRQAWVEALRSLKAETRQRFLPQPPADDHLAGWIALGRLLEELHVELAGQGHGFDDVAARVPAEAAVEAARWRALAELQKAYLGRLRQLDRVDPHWEVRTARAPNRADAGRLVVAGLVELPAAVRRLVEQYAGPCTVLLAAPDSCADHFDSLGQLVVPRWTRVAAPIADEQIRIVGGPREQTAAAAAALRELGGRRSADQIAIGVLDPALAPYLEEELPRLGVRVRAAQAGRLEGSSPGLFLRALESYLRRPTFAGLAALARHPDCERLLDVAEEVPSTVLDKLFGERFPRSLDALQLDANEAAARLRDACDRLLRPLRGVKPLRDWAQPLGQVLAAVFGQRPRKRQSPEDQPIIEACEHLQAALEALRGLDPSSGDAAAADAVLWVLSEAGSQRLTPWPDESAVDLVGWLDLVVDDAEAVILVGCNDEHLPQRVANTLFLSEGLRTRLGLPDNEHRLARDAYHLAALASCPGRTLRVIAGRVTADGEPLRPSRLLLLDDPATVARRLVSSSEADDAAAPGGPPAPRPRRRGVAPGPMRLFDGDAEASAPPLGPWPPVVKGQPLSELSVTAFRDYLESPYRFYLKHVLNLKTLDDQGAELNASAYGTLLHETLQVLGKLTYDELCVAEAVEEALDAELQRIARRTFGGHGPPAVAVQIEQARQRLRAFARNQAQWARDGWRIAHVEHAFDREQSRLDVDGEPLVLRAKADRIDHHAERGQWAILDYKTGDKPRTPHEKHMNREGWIDLQLPLYRYLSRQAGLKGAIHVGYALLPRSLAASRIVLADWSPGQFESAEEKAREIVRAIRRGEFPLVARASDWTDEFSVVCHETFPESIELDDEWEYEL